MKKYQFQKRILLRSIFIMLILFIILTMVFSSYVIKPAQQNSKEQIDVQLRGITIIKLIIHFGLPMILLCKLLQIIKLLMHSADLRNITMKKLFCLKNTDVDYTIKQTSDFLYAKAKYSKNVSVI